MNEQDREALRNQFQGIMWRIIGLSIGWIFFNALFHRVEEPQPTRNVNQPYGYHQENYGRSKHDRMWSRVAENLGQPKQN